MILELVREARAAGARLGPCCRTSRSTYGLSNVAQHRLEGGEDGRRGPKTTPANSSAMSSGRGSSSW